MNAISLLSESARSYPDKIALQTHNEGYTYAQLDLFCGRFAAGLRRSGIKRGQRVALSFTNGPEFVVCYLGIIRAGAIAVSLNPTLQPEEVKFILSDCSASLLLVGEEGRNFTSRDNFDGCEVILCSLSAADNGSFCAWLRDTSPLFEPALMNDDDPLAILYTSGTTGFPKGATLSHGNIRFVAQAAAACCETNPQDRLLLMVPISHCFGQNLIMNHAFAKGATIVLLNGFSPDRLMEAIERERVTMLFAVPAVYALLLGAKAEPARLKTVRYCHSGASPLTEAVATCWLSCYKLPIHQGYGLTECSPLACYNASPEVWPMSIGRPIAGVEMRIVDEDGEQAGLNKPGEVIIRGPNVMRGYWNRATEFRGVDEDGWLHTGDVGMCDDEQNFYLLDRIKDIINVSGLKVYPAEVERILGMHPAVSDSCVYALREPIFGEKVSAKVVTKSGADVRSGDLIAFCRERLAPYKVPETVTFTASLPRNGAGKLLRRVLRNEI